MTTDKTIQRKPPWLRIRLNDDKHFRDVRHNLSKGKLNTVCEEARCPNIHECWGTHKTATFMILGDTCTRHCKFCAVKTGLPAAADPEEPGRVAESVDELGLNHAVITMVTRDDLKDGGSTLLAQTVLAIRERCPDTTVEVLASDMMIKESSIQRIVESCPDINSHNIETVRRMTKLIRSRSDYDRSLEYLKISKNLAPDLLTKSSIMLGLGETREEIVETMHDLRSVHVDILNMGQYLQPTKTHAPVKYYWEPREFRELKKEAMALGFEHCESGPLVRSSYHAGKQMNLIKKRKQLQ